MNRFDAYERLMSIIEQMTELSNEAREIATEFSGRPVYMSNADAYIFNQLAESIDNSNPYNQSIMSLAESIEAYEEEEE